MRDTLLWNVNYWTHCLDKTTEEVAPILKKLHNIPATPLTCEETWQLRTCLQDYASYSHLLKSDLSKPDPKPLPFWKKLFRK